LTRIVRYNAGRKVLTYLNLNNHFEGSAPLIASRLLAALEEFVAFEKF